MEALLPTCAAAALSVLAGWSAPHTASCTSLCLFSLTLLPYPEHTLPSEGFHLNSTPLAPLHVASGLGDKSYSEVSVEGK